MENEKKLELNEAELSEISGGGFKFPKSSQISKQQFKELNLLTYVDKYHCESYIGDEVCLETTDGYFLGKLLKVEEVSSFASFTYRKFTLDTGYFAETTGKVKKIWFVSEV